MKTVQPAPTPLSARAVKLHAAEAGTFVLWTGEDSPSGTPLLLIHSVNAAASAYEVKPLFDYYVGRRPTFALELPGFGHSEKADRIYTVPLMRTAIVRTLEWIRMETRAAPVDVIALSLSSEFAAAAALESPGNVRTLGLISPTGFENKSPVQLMRLPYAKWLLHAALTKPPWSGALYRSLMRKGVIRRFLEKTWGSTEIDEGLLAYDWQLSRQPGAHYAPFSFISGYLFSANPLDLYDPLSLPVWVGHGTRGDFVDYSRLPEFAAARPSRTVSTFASGAFPQFESLLAVVKAYERGVAA